MTTGAIHHLTSERVHHAWDNSLPPLLTIDSGDTVVFDTRDASDGFLRPGITAEALKTPRPLKGHPLTGPVGIRDAAPGDTLEIEVLDLRPDTYGWTRSEER